MKFRYFNFDHGNQNQNYTVENVVWGHGTTPGSALGFQTLQTRVSNNGITFDMLHHTYL